MPRNLTLNIDLSKIKIKKIFKWIKKRNVSDNEMLNTFNCGVGFCIILPKQNISKVEKFFTNEYKPYEIGFISEEKSKVNLSENLRW